jgi:glutamyl-tRNA reductase
MQRKFKALSLSYKSAPVDIRELVSMDDATARGLLIKLKEFFSVTDTLILSTCNRTEIYYSHELDLSLEIIKLLGVEKSLKDPVSLLEYFQVLDDEKDSIYHLFKVSMDWKRR